MKEFDFENLRAGENAQNMLTELDWDDELGSVSFRDETVHGIKRQNISVRTVVFERCVFTDCSFCRCRFDRVLFKNCDLSNVNFTECSFHKFEWVDCKLL